jgi:hypothetical protein
MSSADIVDVYGASVNRHSPGSLDGPEWRRLLWAHRLQSNVSCRRRLSGAISNQTQPKFAERLVEKPDPQDTFSSLDNPFGFTMHNLIWLGGTAAVVVMLIVLRTMGVLH